MTVSDVVWSFQPEHRRCTTTNQVMDWYFDQQTTASQQHFALALVWNVGQWFVPFYRSNKWSMNVKVIGTLIDWFIWSSSRSQSWASSKLTVQYIHPAQIMENRSKYFFHLNENKSSPNSSSVSFKYLCSPSWENVFIVFITFDLFHFFLPFSCFCFALTSILLYVCVTPKTCLPYIRHFE